MRSSLFLGLGAIATTAIATPALAADGDKSTVYGRIGPYFAGSDTKIRLDDPVGRVPGVEVDFESDLDFEKNSSVLEGDIGVRLSDSWALEFQYLKIDRASTATLDKTIKVEDLVFDVNAQVTGTFKSTVYHGKVVWTVSEWDGGDLSVSLGVHATDFGVGIEGQADLPGGGTAFAARSKTKLAPLPTLGARAKFEVAPDVQLFAQGEIFALKIDSVKGSLIDAEAGVVWNFTDNFGVGASYRLLDYNLDVEKPNFLGSIDYGLSGPMIFATFQF